MRRNIKVATLVLFFFSFFFSILFTLQTKSVMLRAESPTPTGVPVIINCKDKASGSRNSISLRYCDYITLTPVPDNNRGGQAVAPPNGDYIAPSSNNCGHYNLSKTGGKNIGDPGCTFKKDALFSLLQQQDPKNASLWFITIVPKESGYDPTIVGFPPGQSGIDAGGAWGLYQMGSSSPAGQPPPAPGKNGEIDRGDVNWEMQTANAINYNKKIGCSFKYWASARSVWGASGC